MAARRVSRSATGQATGRAVSVPLSPPAHVVRRQAGLALPGDPWTWVESTGAVLGGALISGVFIGTLPVGQKWLGALVTGALGLALTTTSPIGTWAQEIGSGTLASSAFWFYLSVTGQIKDA